MIPEDVEVGDRLTFRPAANRDHSAGFPELLKVQRTGVVVQVHREHRWVRVRLDLPGGAELYECFKF